MRLRGAVVLVVFASACGPTAPGTDGGSGGGGAATGGGSGSDAGFDAGTPDAGTADAGAPDAGRDCTPAVLDLDTPFSTTAPPFVPRAGQQTPTALWGNVAGPRPTNAAWQNFVVGPGQNRVDFLPYQLKALPEGLAVALATPVNTANAIDVPDLKQLVFSSLQAFSGRALDAFDPLSVTMRWRAPGGTMTAPMVFGMPYVTVDYVGLRPFLLPGAFTLSSVNGQTNPGVAMGTRFQVVLSDGSTWLLYASTSLTFDWNRGGLTARAAFTGTLRAASLRRPADASLLDAHAATVPRSGRLELSVSCDVATLRFVYSSTGPGPLLLTALPHHLGRLVMPALVDLEYPTLTGTLRAVEGNTWTMALPLTQLDWTAPRPLAPAYVAEVKTALVADVASMPTSVPGDAYFGGKALARLGRLALIADELDEPALAAAVRTRLGPLVGAWLDGTNANPLVYDTTWGGIVTTGSLASPGAEFGAGHYNDHHFHWGYHLYAAAAMARNDPAFAAAHRAGLRAMVRDIANPSASDPHFPRHRAMDFFRGHAWAAGLSEFADGQNQESSSEAVNAWYGMHLVGLVLGDRRMSDLGRVLLTLEIDAAQAYWQMANASPHYGYPFKARHVVGILFQTRAFFGTFFAAGAQYVYGIQMLPFTPVSETLLSRSWVTDSWPDMSLAAMNATPGWRGFLSMTHGVIDRSAAWSEVNALTGWDDGNSKTNALWWVASRPGP
ncbi:MAG: glycosyl hydrolase [Archangium sp.]|nr:glycosyl hydrolase [Archangium sp.]